MEIQQKCASAKEMALLLGTSVNSLNKQRCTKPEDGPPFFRMGSRVLYPLHGEHGFDAWLAAQVDRARH